MINKSQKQTKHKTQNKSTFVINFINAHDRHAFLGSRNNLSEKDNRAKWQKKPQWLYTHAHTHTHTHCATQGRRLGRRSSGSRRVDLVEELVFDHLGHQAVDRLDGRLAAETRRTCRLNNGLNRLWGDEHYSESSSMLKRERRKNSTGLTRSSWDAVPFFVLVKKYIY